MATDSELTMKARGIAKCLTYNEEPEGAAKHLLLEMAHRIDSRDIRVRGKQVVNGIGKTRTMTLVERALWTMFGVLPQRV